MRRVSILRISLVITLLFFGSMAHSAEMWESGKHYTELPVPVTTRDASKIEVVEVFWYGCPHCYEFNNKHLPQWEKSLADDVDFWVVPATFPGWVAHAEAFYAAEFLGVGEKMHQPLFDTIVASPRKYKKVEDLKSLYISNGVKEEDFEKVFETSGFRKVSKIDEAIKKAGERIKSYRISGVPALIVNGKYKIGVREAGGFSNMLKIANFLINKERQSMK